MKSVRGPAPSDGRVPAESGKFLAIAERVRRRRSYLTMALPVGSLLVRVFDSPHTPGSFSPTASGCMPALCRGTGSYLDPPP